MRSSTPGFVPPAPWKILVGLTVVGLGFGLAGAGLVVATGSGYRPQRVELSGAAAEAPYAACQAYARTHFKAPEPATGPPIRQRTVRRHGDGRVNVRWHADRPDARGRLVELRFACTLRARPGERWDLETLTVSTD